MPKLQDFRAILVDVDKTLTNTKRSVSPRSAAAITALQEHGVTVGVCTGRSMQNLKQAVLPLFKPEALHIFSGGSLVANSQREIKWAKYIPAAVAKEIMTKAEEYGAGYCFPHGDDMYANEILMKTYPGLGNPLAPQFKLIDQAQAVDVPILPVLGVPLEFVNYLAERSDVNFKEMMPYPGYLSVDVTPPNINKAVGIQEWSKLTGIQPEEVIGFGDSENDDEFLDVVGFGVAMGNATEYLKSKADRVIGHTDQDGLAIYVEQLLKGAEL